LELRSPVFPRRASGGCGPCQQIYANPIGTSTTESAGGRGRAGSAGQASQPVLVCVVEWASAPHPVLGATVNFLTIVVRAASTGGGDGETNPAMPVWSRREPEHCVQRWQRPGQHRSLKRRVQRTSGSWRCRHRGDHGEVRLSAAVKRRLWFLRGVEMGKEARSWGLRCNSA